MWILWNKIYFIKIVFENFMDSPFYELMQILGHLGMSFDAAVIFVTFLTFIQIGSHNTVSLGEGPL